jgi:hypothetical protein
MESMIFSRRWWQIERSNADVASLGKLSDVRRCYHSIMTMKWVCHMVERNRINGSGNANRWLQIFAALLWRRLNILFVDFVFNKV